MQWGAFLGETLAAEKLDGGWNAAQLRGPFLASSIPQVCRCSWLAPLVFEIIPNFLFFFFEEYFCPSLVCRVGEVGTFSGLREDQQCSLLHLGRALRCVISSTFSFLGKLVCLGFRIWYLRMVFAENIFDNVVMYWFHFCSASGDSWIPGQSSILHNVTLILLWGGMRGSWFMRACHKVASKITKYILTVLLCVPLHALFVWAWTLTCYHLRSLTRKEYIDCSKYEFTEFELLLLYRNFMKHVWLGGVLFAFRFEGGMGMPQSSKTQSLLSSNIKFHSDSNFDSCHESNALGEMDYFYSYSNPSRFWFRFRSQTKCRNFLLLFMVMYRSRMRCIVKC